MAPWAHRALLASWAGPRGWSMVTEAGRSRRVRDTTHSRGTERSCLWTSLEIRAKPGMLPDGDGIRPPAGVLQTGPGPGPVLAEPGRPGDSGPPGLAASAGLWASKPEIDQVPGPRSTPLPRGRGAGEPAWPRWWSVHTGGPLGAPILMYYE